MLNLKFCRVWIFSNVLLNQGVLCLQGFVFLFTETRFATAAVSVLTRLSVIPSISCSKLENSTRTQTPWHSIHGHGWSRPGHQWIQSVDGHCKFHRWPWMVHGWSTTGHRWSFEKFFEQKFVRSAKVRNVR